MHQLRARTASHERAGRGQRCDRRGKQTCACHDGPFYVYRERLQTKSYGNLIQLTADFPVQAVANSIQVNAIGGGNPSYMVAATQHLANMTEAERAMCLDIIKTTAEHEEGELNEEVGDSEIGESKDA